MGKYGRVSIPDPGFGTRVSKLRHRLKLKQYEFAEKLGIPAPTLNMWELRNRIPAMNGFTKAIKRLGVCGWKDLLVWLADGEDPAPAWLDDPALDPYAVEPPPPGSGPGLPDNVIAFPISAAHFVREAFSSLDAERRQSRSLLSPAVLHAWDALEHANRVLPGPSAGSPRSGPEQNSRPIIPSLFAA